MTQLRGREEGLASQMFSFRWLKPSYFTLVSIRGHLRQLEEGEDGLSAESMYLPSQQEQVHERRSHPGCISY